jgi:hypothetical protein
MTLVLYIPHIEGFSLVADRQKTYSDLTAITTQKLFSFKDMGVVVGCSGTTVTFEDIIRKLKYTVHSSPITDEIEDIFHQNHEEFQETARLLGENVRLEMIVSIMENRTVKVERFEYVGNPNLRRIQLAASRSCAVGSFEAVKWLEPQLNRQVDNIKRKQALDFAYALICYAARVDKKIGPPEQYGCDSLTVKKNGDIEEQWMKPRLDAIEGLLYRFGRYRI